MSFLKNNFEIFVILRDKLEDISRDNAARDGFYYNKFGKQIVQNYRY